jgi:hypothetical protein
MTREELNSQTLVVPFVELEPHVQRGTVIVLHDRLDLAEVGLMLARDDQAGIRELLLNAELTKASRDDFEQWREEKKFFRILIIQPFVLAQHFAALAQPTTH